MTACLSQIMNVSLSSRIGPFIPWAVTLGLLMLLLLFSRSPAASAQAPWPTPPPAPIGSLPQVVPASQVIPIPAPETPGGIAVQLDPIFAGILPRIPPLPFIPILTGESDPRDQIALEFEVGAINRTLQLSYQPLPIGQVPLVDQRRSIQRVFQIEMFDQTGAPVAVEFARPVRLRLQAQQQERLAGASEPARLLLARLDSRTNTWLPLVTVLDLSNDTIITRIIQPGIFALIAQPPPVPR